MNEDSQSDHPDEEETCHACGVRVFDHGDECDPAVLHEAGLERAAERIMDMDRDDWEANSD